MLGSWKKEGKVCVYRGGKEKRRTYIDTKWNKNGRVARKRKGNKRDILKFNGLYIKVY